MLLKKLSVVNNEGAVLDLPLDDTSGGFLVKDILGLGPAKATLASTPFARLDGAHYHSSRLEPRNVVIKLGLTPDYASSSVYELRAELYNFFMTKTEALLRFQMFDRFSSSFTEQFLNVEIKGRIESFEVDQFSNDPTVDLSVMCFRPEFVIPELSIFEDASVADLTETEVTYFGTLATGFVFTIYPGRTVDNLAIYHRTPDQKLYLVNFNEIMYAQDILTISSVFGEKYVTLTRNGVEHNRLFSLSSQSNWLELQRGANHLRVYSQGDPIPYKLEWQTKYGGL